MLQLFELFVSLSLKSPIRREDNLVLIMLMLLFIIIIITIILYLYRIITTIKLSSSLIIALSSALAT